MKSINKLVTRRFADIKYSLGDTISEDPYIGGRLLNRPKRLLRDPLRIFDPSHSSPMTMDAEKFKIKAVRSILDRLKLNPREFTYWDWNRGDFSAIAWFIRPYSIYHKKRIDYISKSIQVPPRRKNK